MNPISSFKYPSLHNTEVLSCWVSICLKGSCKNLSILLSPIQFHHLPLSTPTCMSPRSSQNSLLLNCFLPR